MKLSEKQKTRLWKEFSQVLDDTEIEDIEVHSTGRNEVEITWFMLSTTADDMVDVVEEILDDEEKNN